MFDIIDRFRDYDDSLEDRYSLPKRGKMVMGNRELGPHDESKDFTVQCTVDSRKDLCGGLLRRR